MASNPRPHGLRLAFVLAALCAGCAGTDFEWDKARQVRPGMNEDEVRALLGPPATVRKQPWGATWTWAYVDPGPGKARAVSVGFSGDGRVVYGAGVPESFVK